jgi:ABC-type multidrug transport system fused ATPase/permease subunit
VGCGITQASALAFAAFATRDAFAALHSGAPLAARTMLALALSGALAAACLFMARRQAEALGQSYAMSLRLVLYEAIARLPKSRHEQRRIGALSLRFVGDLSAARLWYGRGLPDLLTALVVLPGAVLILFALDPALAAIGLAPLALALAGMGGLAFHLEQRHRRLRRRRASIAIAMIERIAIAPDLDLIGRTDKELRALDAQGVELKADAVARRGRTAGLQAILQAGVALSGLAMLSSASKNGVSPASVAASLSVLALVALPLQDLASAWDRFCAWRVAREKVRHLMSEPSLHRSTVGEGDPVTITLCTEIGGEPVSMTAKAGAVTHLAGKHSGALARIIAGLDPAEDMELAFNEQRERPKIAFIGDNHVGLQGSLRRSATLSATKRPKDEAISELLDAFGLGDLLRHPRGLDQRIAEKGKELTPSQTLRLDLARAVIGGAGAIVISSTRWQSEPERRDLLDTLQQRTSATIVVAGASTYSTFTDDMKAL